MFAIAYRVSFAFTFSNCPQHLSLLLQILEKYIYFSNSDIGPLQIIGHPVYRVSYIFLSVPYALSLFRYLIFFHFSLSITSEYLKLFGIAVRVFLLS